MANLPGEILGLVFRSLDNFPSLAALCLTSRVFYGAWKLSARRICHAIVGPDAVELARLQKLIAQSDQDKPSSAEIENYHEKVLSDAKVFAANDRHVRLAGKLWEEEVTPLCTQWGTRKIIFSGKERLRFQRAYYRFLVLNALHCSSNSLVERLKCMTPRDFEGVRQVADWLQYGCSWDSLVKLKIIPAERFGETNGGEVESGYSLMSEDWQTVCSEIVHKQRGMEYRQFLDLQDIVELDGFPKDVPLLVWSFFDETQQYVDLISDAF